MWWAPPLWPPSPLITYCQVLLPKRHYLNIRILVFSNACTVTTLSAMPWLNPFYCIVVLLNAPHTSQSTI